MLYEAQDGRGPDNALLEATGGAAGRSHHLDEDEEREREREREQEQEREREQEQAVNQERSLLTVSSLCPAPFLFSFLSRKKYYPHRFLFPNSSL